MSQEPAVPRTHRTITLPPDRSVSALWAPWSGQDPIEMRRSFWRCTASDQSRLVLPPCTWLSVYMGKPNLAWLDSLRPDTLQGLSFRCSDRGELRAALEVASHLTGLIQLSVVTGPGVTGADLACLGAMATLTELRLEGGDLGDELIDRLEGMPQLLSLALEHTRITPGGLARLVALPHMRHLSLAGMDVPKDILSRLATMPSLEILDLDGCMVEEDAVVEFRRSKKLRLLETGRTRIGSRSRRRKPSRTVH